MSNPARFERNLGFLSSVEQGVLENSSIAIAGAGGDGGALALQLARMGVGELRLADPDPFEIENINRQAVCTESTLGTNKAVAVGEYVQQINPDVSVKIYTDGITESNTREFVKGTDLVIDETEFTMQHLAVMLAREAREEGVPNLTALNIGFAAVTTTYHPEGTTLEKRLGFADDQDLESIKAEEVRVERWLPYLPNYGDMDVLKKVASGEKSAPSIAPGVAIAASMGATQAMLNLLHTSGNKNNRQKPVYAPKALVMDVMTGQAKKIRYNRSSHYRHAAGMAVRNALKLTPKASY